MKAYYDSKASLGQRQGMDHVLSSYSLTIRRMIRKATIVLQLPYVSIASYSIREQ